MKNIKFLSALILIFTAFTFTSCVNEPIDSAIDLSNPNPDNGGGGTTGAFTAKIGTVDFNANQSVISNYTTTALGNQLAITGITSEGKTIFIQMINPTVGTRTGNGNPNSLLLFQYFASGNDQYSSLNTASGAYNGTINITDFNVTTNKVSGTFSFTGYGLLTNTAQVEVNTGVFTNISFTNSVVTPPVNTSVVGTYKLTAFNTSVPTDLSGDGTASTNQMAETTCFNNSLFILNANGTFTANSKGIDIDLTSTPNTLTCSVDPDVTGTWVLNGNILKTTYVDSGVTIIDEFTVIGNTLVITANDGEVVGTANGNPVFLTADITVIYTKQ